MQWPPNIPTEREMDRLLAQAKMQVFTHKGAAFHGSLLCNHELLWSDINRTAWCDGKQIGLNPEFFYTLDMPGRVATIVHELRHTAHDHFTRFREMSDADRKTYNMASDFVINNDMDNTGFSVSSWIAAGISPCLDHRFDGMTTEQVYYILKKEQEDNGGSSQYSSDMCDDLQEGEPDASGNSSGTGQNHGTKTSQTIQKVIQAQTASQIGGDAVGTVPGETELLIKEFLYPQMPWEVLLNRWMTELSTDDYSYRRPNRRYEDEILPSLVGDSGLEHLIYFLDVSGSVRDEEIQQFNSEARYIHQNIQPERMTLVTFDTSIRDVYEFAKDDAFDAIKVVGRGGTSLQPVYEMIKERKPTAAVIFTDLYCAPMKDPGVPVLWTISGNPNATVDHGTLVHFK